MKILFSTCVILLLSFISRAQHCPYDGAALLVVSISTEDGQSFAENDILISIRDVHGNIIYRNGSPEVFVLNPKQTFPLRPTYDHEKISFAFAGDNFIHSFSAYMVNEYEKKGGLYIYVNPLSGKYNPVIRKLVNKDVYDLHYINEYVPFRSDRTEPVPENSKAPFAPYLIKFVLTKQAPIN